MHISRRAHYEIGVLVGIIGLCLIITAVMRFEAFLDSDQRFRMQFEPYLITQSFRESPKNSKENHQNFLHRKAVYNFYPSGSPYSRCAQMVIACASGMTVTALGACVCLRARRRRDRWV